MEFFYMTSTLGVVLVLCVILRKFTNSTKTMIGISQTYIKMIESHQSEVHRLLVASRALPRPTKYVQIDDIPEKQLQAIIKVITRRMDFKAAGICPTSDRETWPETCFYCPSRIG